MKRWLPLLIVALLGSSPLRAAFTEFYCSSTTGNNTNSGDTALTTPTTSYVGGTFTQFATTGAFVPASGSPSGSGMSVGSFASVWVAGQSTTSFVARITEVWASSFTVLLSAKSGANPTTGTYNATIGGAWAGPTGAISFPFNFAANTMTDVAGDFPRVNFKASTYSITAAMTHTLAGPVRFEGYSSTVGDGGRATIDGGTSGAAFTLLTVSGASTYMKSFIFSNNGATGGNSAIYALNMTGQGDFIENSIAHDLRGSCFNIGSNGGVAQECEVYNYDLSSVSGFGFSVTGASAFAIRCIAHDATNAGAVGFNSAVQANYFFCIADTVRTGFVLGNVSTSIGMMYGCEAYNCTTDGLQINHSAATNTNFLIENSNFVKNGGWGINGTGSGSWGGAIINCGFGTGTMVNTSGTTNNTKAMVISGSVNYPANMTPWVDPDNGDFRINLPAAKLAGRGSFVETAPSYSGTTGYPDIGAAQHLNNPSAFTFVQ